MKASILIVVMLFQQASSAIAAGPIFPGGEFHLSEKEVDSYRGLALGGDIGAANKLSDYFSFYLNDSESGVFWLKVAAEYGDCEAINEVSYRYKFLIRKKDEQQILYWKRRAREFRCSENN